MKTICASFALLICCLALGCRSNPANVQFPSHHGSAAAGCGLPAPGTFQEAFVDMQFPEARPLAANDAQRQLLSLAETILLSPDEIPASRLALPENEPDSLIRHQWQTLNQSYHWLRDDYARAAEGIDPGTAAMSIGFSGIERPERITYGNADIRLPLHRSSTGSPMVDVRVNGRAYRFWLDSGAGVSVISSDVARQTGITGLTGDGRDLNTSTRRVVSAAPALIDSMAVGELRVYNHPCVILDKKDLIFRLLGIRFLKIDGIIGWPLLKQLDLEFDLPRARLTIFRPESGHDSDHRLGWFWQPFLQASTPSGCRLNLQIDTGSSTTFFHPSAYPKMGLQPDQKGYTVRAGAGGKETVPYDRLDSCRFNLAGEPVLLLQAQGIADNPGAGEFFAFDGVLGQDVLALGRFRMDFPNRRYAFYPEGNNGD